MGGGAGIEGQGWRAPVRRASATLVGLARIAAITEAGAAVYAAGLESGCNLQLCDIQQQEPGIAVIVTTAIVADDNELLPAVDYR